MGPGGQIFDVQVVTEVRHRVGKNGGSIGGQSFEVVRIELPIWPPGSGAIIFRSLGRDIRWKNGIASPIKRVTCTEPDGYRPDQRQSHSGEDLNRNRSNSPT